MRQHRFAIVLAILAVIGCCAYAPWIQGDPTDAVSLGFAPIWTTGFQHFPGARVDLSAFATDVCLAIVFAALIGLGQAMRRSE